MDALISSLAALLVVMGIMMAVAGRTARTDNTFLTEIRDASDNELDSWSGTRINKALDHVDTLIGSDPWTSEPEKLHTLAHRLQESLDRHPEHSRPPREQPS